MTRRRSDYGIRGYNPNKPSKPAKYFNCPHCWRVLKSQSALTLHIKNEHWGEKENGTKP